MEDENAGVDTVVEALTTGTSFRTEAFFPLFSGGGGPDTDGAFLIDSGRLSSSSVSRIDGGTISNSGEDFSVQSLSIFNFQEDSSEEDTVADLTNFRPSSEAS